MEALLFTSAENTSICFELLEKASGISSRSLSKVWKTECIIVFKCDK